MVEESEVVWAINSEVSGCATPLRIQRLSVCDQLARLLVFFRPFVVGVTAIVTCCSTIDEHTTSQGSS